MTHDEMIELLVAHRDGQKLQYRSLDKRLRRGWNDYGSEEPPLLGKTLEWRIKPIVVDRMKPGFELDKAVAEAMGFGYRVEGDQVILPELTALSPYMPATWNPRVVFNPSTDLNVAFAAAQGVFKCGFALHTPGVPAGGWGLFRCIVGIGWDEKRHQAVDQLGVERSTPCLAICAAILKLKERTNGTGPDDSRRARPDRGPP